MTSLGPSNGRITYSGTINLGHILVIVAFIGSVAGLYATQQVTFHDHTLRIERLEEVSEKYTERHNNIMAEFQVIKNDLSVIKFRMNDEEDGN